MQDLEAPAPRHREDEVPAPGTAVEAALAEEAPDRAPEPASLRSIEAEIGGAGARGAAADLDEHEDLALAQDEIDLVASDADASREEAMTAATQVAERGGFGLETPPRGAGDGVRVTATAEEISRTGRSGIYDVRVTRGDGTVVADMRGCSRALNGQHFDESE